LVKEELNVEITKDFQCQKKLKEESNPKGKGNNCKKSGQKESA
jgi:hypothetical protein